MNASRRPEACTRDEGVTMHDTGGDRSFLSVRSAHISERQEGAQLDTTQTGFCYSSGTPNIFKWEINLTFALQGNMTS